MQSGSSPAATSVTVSRLELRDFRCHRRFRLELGPGPVVLIGGNGTGKTSILEALSLLAPGRGLRRARLGEMIRSESGTAADGWSMRVRLGTPGGPTDVDTVYARECVPAARERLRASLDGQPLRSRAALADIAGVIWLTPDMDRLFTEAPSGRRRFLDRVVWGVDAAHAARVAAYERAMQQRSALLRQDAPDTGWLAALEETMAELGIAVAAARRLVAAQLSAITGAPTGAFPSAVVDTRGAVEGWLDEGPALHAEERLREALAASRSIDARSGGATVGPHRSDVTVRQGSTGRPADACSTGEQKMLLIALVLAGARLQRIERGAGPLLLLDEVVAHLDARHRGAVFETVDELSAQAWYAGTDRAPYRPLEGHAQFVTIDPAGDVSGSTAGEPAGTAIRSLSDD